jgi:hypothetical protein
VSLLDKALEAKVSNRQKKGASTEEVELAVAYYRGRVSGHQLLAALGMKVENTSSASKGWAEKVLRAGLADGRVTLIVEAEADEDAEFDKRHEAAKAAPLAVAGKAVGR